MPQVKRNFQTKYLTKTLLESSWAPRSNLLTNLVPRVFRLHTRGSGHHSLLWEDERPWERGCLLTALFSCRKVEKEQAKFTRTCARHGEHATLGEHLLSIFDLKSIQILAVLIDGLSHYHGTFIKGSVFKYSWSITLLMKSSVPVRVIGSHRHFQGN